MNEQEDTWLVYPVGGGTRAPAPPEAPEDIARDYNEACAVLALSPQASAALSRRCLQHVLNVANISKKHDLGKAIDEALESGLPTHIKEDLDAIRQIGNFAAHPQKSIHTGEVLPVEAGEAEWNLDVLEQMFDFCFVQPAKSKAKREALNKKLEEAGKAPMKQPK